MNNNNNGLAGIWDIAIRCEQIREQLKVEVFGQDKAVDEVVDAFAESILFQDADNRRPRGIFLFAGTPGVGKTYLAKQCAKHLGFPSKVFDMSSYSAREDGLFSFMGSDPIWRGAKEGDLLEFVDQQGNQPCVVVLDEIEKANIQVIMQLLQILENGTTANPYVTGTKRILRDIIELCRAKITDTDVYDVAKRMFGADVENEVKEEIKPKYQKEFDNETDRDKKKEIAQEYQKEVEKQTEERIRAICKEKRDEVFEGFCRIEMIKQNRNPDMLKRNDNVSFSNVYFIFTTNAGRPLYENGKQPALDLTKDAIIDAIRKDMNPETKEPYFPDAILSRFQTGRVIMFRHLDTNAMLQIGQKEMIKNINLIAQKYGLEIGIESKVATLLLLKEGGQVDARNFRKIAEDFVQNQVMRLSISLKEEMRDVKKIRIGIDPEEKESLNHLLFGEQMAQDVIFVCEEQGHYFELVKEMNGVDEINLHGTTDYAEALDMVKKEIFSTPMVLAVMPSLEERSLTMAASNSAMLASTMKEFKKFIEMVKTYNEKTCVCVVNTDNISQETKNDLLRMGATEIINITEGADIQRIVRSKVNTIRLNNMAFDFARKRKALKYDLAPVVYDDTVYLRFRFFEKIDNIKAGDDDFLIGQNRMPNVSFSEVIGGEKIKDEAADFISFLQNPKTFVNKGLKAPKGLLFYGPAGTGKTFMAKAIAHEAGVPFIATNGGDVRKGTKDKSGAELLKQYFEVARKYAPSILFIDEMETIALNRTGADPGADAIVNVLLAEMDGFEGHDANPVIVIGATNAGIDRENHVDGRFLDPAVVRRFTRKFFVDVPGKKDRLKKLTDTTGLPEEDLETAALMSKGLSFGNLGNAIEIAKRQAVREGRALTKEDVQNAVETLNYGEVHYMNTATKQRVAVHEAGHACICCILGDEYMPSYATIISRGDHGGYVSPTIDEGSGIFLKEFFENHIRIDLAGRCAEIIFYGEKQGLSSGASSDIMQAYGLIHEMVCHLGMDEQIGIEYCPNTNGSGYLPADVKQRIDELMKKYYEETMQMLSDHKALWETLTRELLRKDSLGQAELMKIAEKYHG